MRIVGIDLSLTSTGLAELDNSGSAIRARVTKLAPGDKRKGHERLRWLCSGIHAAARGADLAVVEGPAFGRPQGQHQLGGLWWMATHVIWLAGIKTVVVPPSTLKKYATGNGGANKDTVLAAVVRRYLDVEVTGNDEADALVLAAMGADYHGWPLAAVPQTHRAVLDKWPYQEM